MFSRPCSHRDTLTARLTGTRPGTATGRSMVTVAGRGGSAGTVRRRTRLPATEPSTAMATSGMLSGMLQQASSQGHALTAMFSQGCSRGYVLRHVLTARLSRPGSHAGSHADTDKLTGGSQAGSHRHMFTGKFSRTGSHGQILTGMATDKLSRHALYRIVEISREEADWN
jgi:hypothetical protein